MSKSDILVSVIKELIKSEVNKAKLEIKEDVINLIKSNRLIINNNVPKSNKPVVKETKVVNKPTAEYPNPKRKLSTNPIINEILNQTQPFTAAERVTGENPMQSMSVLDMIDRKSEDDWGTINMNSNAIQHQPTPQPTVESTGNSALDAVTKALNRDYTSLVKHPKFK